MTTRDTGLTLAILQAVVAVALFVLAMIDLWRHWRYGPY